MYGPLGVANNSINGTLRYSLANNFDYSYRFGAGQPYSIDTAGQNITFATSFEHQLPLRGADGHECGDAAEQLDRSFDEFV